MFYTLFLLLIIVLPIIGIATMKGLPSGEPTPGRVRDNKRGGSCSMQSKLLVDPQRISELLCYTSAKKRHGTCSVKAKKRGFTQVDKMVCDEG